MFCFLHQWFISRQTDLGRTLPRITAKHIQSCPSCRKYSALCNILPDRLTSDSNRFIRPYHLNIHQRVQQQLKDQETSQRKVRPAWRSRPVWGTLIFLLLCLTGFLILNRNLPPEHSGPLDNPSFTLSLASASLPRLIAQTQSPLEAEYDELKRTFHKAQDLLATLLDIRLSGKK